MTFAPDIAELQKSLYLRDASHRMRFLVREFLERATADREWRWQEPIALPAVGRHSPYENRRWLCRM